MSPRTGGRFRDWSLLVVCNFIWSSYFVMVKLVQDQIGTLFTTTFPILIATLLLLLFLVFHGKATGRERWKYLNRADARGFLLVGICGQGVTQLFGVWGGQLSPASNASLIMLGLPIVTALMAFLILGERMTPIRWLGFALSILGVLVCSDMDWTEVKGQSGLALVANAMLFVSVLASAFYNVYSKRLLKRHEPLALLFWSYAFALSALLPPTILLDTEGFMRIPYFTLTTWFGLFVLAVLFYFVAMVIFLTVLTRLEATQAGLSNYMIPFFGVVLSAIVLGERLTPAAVLGGALILVGTLTASLGRAAAKPVPEVASELRSPPALPGS